MAGAVELTETRIDKLIKEGVGREVRDKGGKGLVLRLSSVGAASWSYQYRRRDGTKGRVTLGTYTNDASRKSTRKALTLKQAREAAVAIRSEIAAGRDPVAAKAERVRWIAEREAAEAAELSVGAMLDLWLAQKSGLKTNADDRKMMLRDVMAPEDVDHPLGAIRLGKVGKRDVARVIDRIINRGSPVTATRLLRRLNAAFVWAIGRGYLTANPCAGIEAPTNYRERARERVLDTMELRAFFATLPATYLPLSFKRILHLQALLGQRLGEVCGMRKTEVDLDACLWSIPGARVKNGRDHVIPLPPESRTIIMSAMADAGPGRYVFPSRDTEKPIIANSVSHALERLQHLPDGYVEQTERTKHSRLIPKPVVFGFLHPQTGEKHPFTSHDLRRSLATHVERLGVPLRVISKLLNHSEAKSVTDAVYARADLMAERYEALVRWERALKDIRDGKDPFAFSQTTFRDIEARILGNQPIMIEGAAQ